MSKPVEVLLVDDDPRLIRFVRANLETFKYKVVVAENAEAALRLLYEQTVNLIILDIMLPHMDGFEFCRRVRQFSYVPIIMLTAKAEDSDKIRGLKLGADDYLTKPFGVQELLARVEAVLRRSNHADGASADSPTFNCGDLSIDFIRYKMTKKGEEIPLTPTEYRLLFTLVKNVNKVMFHEQLLSCVWGQEYRDEVEYLRAYVRHLRRKIEDDPGQPKYVISRPGIGYMFACPG
jgi:two-component system KDP operon response regulator KdpE